MPGNPWQHDMTITIENSPPFLIELLFVRSAWHLDPAGVPRLDREPDPGTSARPRRPAVDELERLWLIDWQSAWTQYQDPVKGRAPDEDALRHIAESSYEQLVEEFTARPSAIWHTGLDSGAVNAWRMSLVDNDRTPLIQSPERQALPALIHAWHQGIDTIVQLPYRGHLAQQLSRRHLLVSGVTRHDRDLYTEALADI